MALKDYQGNLAIPDALKDAYSDASTVPVSEIFHSFQGEGRNAGRNAVFVRFWGCNLACAWCDTPYSWKADYVSHMVKIPAEFVADLIAEKYRGANVVIFTGGEPSLFEPGILEIMNALARKGMGHLQYEIETNGSRRLSNYYDQINVSPKLPSSGNRAYPVLVDSPKADFKFVVGSESDIADMEALLNGLERRPSPDRIWLMPLGTDSESQVRLATSLVIPHALAKGYNLSIRQQIVLFGDTKGT